MDVSEKDQSSETVSMPRPMFSVAAAHAPYIEIVPDAKPSESFDCGARTLRGMPGADELNERAKHALTQRCYDLDPGSSCKLRIRFCNQDSSEKPKGTLRVQTSRGRLSQTSVDLDGSQESVEIEYRAPDETIKVSIRAFLGGFRRGKIHLHLGG